MKREKITYFVESNFTIHTDWTGPRIEATRGTTLPELVDLLDEFINNGDDD